VHLRRIKKAGIDRKRQSSKAFMFTLDPDGKGGSELTVDESTLVAALRPAGSPPALVNANSR
jgi:hypothetical protein